MRWTDESGVMEVYVRPFPAGSGKYQISNGGGKMPIWSCQRKVEMSPRWQSRNVPFCLGLFGVHVILRLPVKRRRAMLASNPIEE